MSDQKKPKKSTLGSIVKIGLLVIVVIVVAVVGYGFTLAKEYHYERSIVIKADSGDIHEWVGDVKKWDEWGPWREEDPTMKVTYGEKTEGVGASWSWTGEKSGNGKMTFLESDPKKGIKYLLEFEGFDPVTGEMRYDDAGDDQVKVTWSFESGEAPFHHRYMHTLFGEKMMNEMFDKGLNKLKSKVEAN
jgi:hypothetical protein